MKKIVAVILLILSMIFLFKGFTDIKYKVSNKSKNDSIRELVTSDEMADPLDRVIDFQKLKAINEDVKAWIYIPGTKVDYPILVGKENEEYLYKDIDKEYTPLGSLFSFKDTNLTKGNTFIFGHNMASSQMFGELKKYLSSDFLEENRYIYLYTERKAMKCDIFSIFIANENDDVFSGEYELGTTEYIDLLSELVNRNKYGVNNLEKNIIEYSTTQVFNLITCYGREGTSDRLIVNGIVVEEKIR